MKAASLPAALLFLVCSAQGAQAAELKGPARFCGYSPIIDLLEGERIVTLSAGIHGGSSRWTGAFGTLEVQGIGLGSPPDEWTSPRPTSKGHLRFEERRERGRYVVALWNRSRGLAYFRSRRPLTSRQLAAIDRVDLFDEGQDPKGCNLRTISVWE